MTRGPEDRRSEGRDLPLDDRPLIDRTLDARLRAHFAATQSATLPDEVAVAARARIARHERTSRRRGLLLVAVLAVVAIGTASVMSGARNPQPGPLVPATPTAPPTASSSPWALRRSVNVI